MIDACFLRDLYVRQVRWKAERDADERGTRILLARQREQYETAIVRLARPRPKTQIKLKGVVYVIRAFNGLYKIGQTTHLKSRLGSLNVLGEGSVELIHVIKCDFPVAAEWQIHQRLRFAHVERELFELSPALLGWICSIQELKAGDLLPELA